jgi:glycerol-3-phosphate dehydrogenase
VQTTESDVLVMGAGLLGSGVALELAQRGTPSVLLERDHQAINRASLRNEGKIHLGLIYANDVTRSTAELQLRGALKFRSTVSSWLQVNEKWLSTSTPFSYLVADDSILSVEQLSEHFAAVDDLWCKEFVANPAADYLGRRPEQLTWQIPDSDIDSRLKSDRLQALFGTAELAIDTESLAVALRGAIAAATLIDARYRCTVREVERVGDRYIIGGDGPEGPWQIRCNQVVNATWEQRLKIDAQLGLQAPKNLLHRLKYRVIAELPADMIDAPSVTMVLGKYGDVVVRSDGTAYLSWYPVGLQGWSDELAPPDSWDSPSRGEPDPEIGRRVIAGFLKEIEQWFTGIERSRPILVDAGTIVAFGTTDVDDVSSGLHDRSRVGVESQDGYHTVDGGKLTTGPMFAVETADCVMAHAS